VNSAFQLNSKKNRKKSQKKIYKNFSFEVELEIPSSRPRAKSILEARKYAQVSQRTYPRPRTGYISGHMLKSAHLYEKVYRKHEAAAAAELGRAQESWRDDEHSGDMLKLAGLYEIFYRKHEAAAAAELRKMLENHGESATFWRILENHGEFWRILERNGESATFSP